ncbi:MAG TPA: hypothetical protein VGM78_14640 [Ilumatobacteraceae bacterium]
MGYDPNNLQALRAAMSRAAVELGGIRSGDPESTHGMAAIKSIRSLLTDRWLPLIDSLSGCRAMTGYTPVLLAADDVQDSLLNQRTGWRVFTDPLAPPADPVTLEQAIALAKELSGRDPHQPFSDDEIAALRVMLAQIAAYPALDDAFITTISPQGWNTMVDQLGGQRQELITTQIATVNSDQPSAQVTAIDDVFAGLSAAFVNWRTAHPDQLAVLQISDMHPYGAALLVRGLQLDARSLALATVQIISDERDALYAANPFPLGPNAADLLLPIVEATPGAATELVMDTVDDPGLLLNVANDPTFGNRVLIRGTAPNNMSASQAAVAVPAYAGYVFAALHSSTLSKNNPLLDVAAADLVSPYLAEFAATPAAKFDVPKSLRHSLKSLLLDDQVALDELVQTSSSMIRTLTTPTAGEYRISDDALRNVASIVGYLQTLQREATVHQAKVAAAQWDLLFTTVERMLGIIGIPMATVGSVVVGVGGYALERLHDVMAKEGWGIPNVGSVERSAARTYELQTTVTAAAMVDAAYDRLQAFGQLPAGAQPPPQPNPDAESVARTYRNEFATWLDDAGFDPQTHAEMESLADDVLSDHEAASMAADD